MLFGTLALAAALVTATGVYADSAAQITVTNCQLLYVKHVNDLPPGTTRLQVTNKGPEQQIRIKFGALAEDGSFVQRIIDDRLRCGETTLYRITWGQPITDLNFIQIIGIGNTRKTKAGSQ
jgi:hypothetical protein